MALPHACIDEHISYIATYLVYTEQTQEVQLLMHYQLTGYTD